MVSAQHASEEQSPLLPTDADADAAAAAAAAAAAPADHVAFSPTFRHFLSAFWPITFIAFGGPQAHVALFHHKFVDTAVPPVPRLPQSTFLELYALAQSLPGPGSTQLAASLGATYGGLLGALVTFVVWHVPGFVVMSVAGVWFHRHLSDHSSLALVHRVTQLAVGLIAAAFAFVLIAAFKIVNGACADHAVKMAIAMVSMFVAVTTPPAWSSWLFIVLLLAGGACFYVYTRLTCAEHTRSQHLTTDVRDWHANVSRAAGAALLVTCALITVLVALLPSSDLGFRVLKIFWRIGLCVFGGGVVVVPMLMNDIVESGLLPSSVFLAGFGLFGCVPGPMFNLAPFLGAAIVPWRGALFGSLGLFAPGLLLQIGLLPFWQRVRRIRSAQIVLQGTNAAASGLIVAGVWMLLKKTFVAPGAFALTCTAAAMALVYRVPPAVNVLAHGALGLVMVLLNIGGAYA